MSNLRLFLILAIFSVGFLLWQQWQIDYGPRPVPGTQQAGNSTPSDASVPPMDVPTDMPAAAADDAVPAVAMDAETPTQPAVEPAAQRIQVQTDVLHIEISTRGGDVVDAHLLDYPVELSAPDQVVQLLSADPVDFYVAQTGLLSATHQSPDHRQLFSATSRDYRLGSSADTLEVPLRWTGPDGIEVEKIYRFTRGSYAIEVMQRVRNGSDQSWNGAQYRQLQRVIPPEPAKGNGFTNPERYSFKGAAWYSPENHYEKFEFEEIGDDPENMETAAGWAAMVQHYFISAWIPPKDETTQYSTSELKVPGQIPRYLVRAIAPPVKLAPGEERALSTTLYVGPKLQDSLDDLAEGLTLTVDYGIFTPFSKVLYWLLAHIHNLVGNWGWAIVLLTVLVKGVFFKLTEAQYKSMAKMRKLQPRIQSLKERYGDDKQKFNMAMMDIYKKEKVNPLGGCLPLLIQIPVFIALYWVLLESVELRQASFIFWLNDLSSPDPYFILPIINGAAMFMTTKLSPNPAADPIQQKIMLAMPLVFSVMFAFFQSGLVLYWAVNSVLSLAQQWVITQRIDREG